MLGADSDTWDGAIGEDKNGIDGADLNLGLNPLPLELVLLETARIGEPRRVEDANLGKRLCTLTMFTNVGAYHYAVLAFKFVYVGGVRLALARAALLVGTVENVKVVIITVIAGKDNGN